MSFGCCGGGEGAAYFRGMGGACGARANVLCKGATVFSIVLIRQPSPGCPGRGLNLAKATPDRAAVSRGAMSSRRGLALDIAAWAMVLARKRFLSLLILPATPQGYGALPQKGERIPWRKRSD